MKLVKQDIANIDSWLKRKGIKYIDVRYELIDHLVTEYESIENYPDLKSFLMERKVWCKKIAKEKQKAVNFGMTKSIFYKFLSLFTSMKSLLMIAIACVFAATAKSYFPDEIVVRALFGIAVFLVVFQIYLTIYSGFGTRLKKESLSVVYLINIFALPNIPLYVIGLIPKDWLYGPNFYFPFFGFLILINLSATLVFFEKRNQLLKEFDLLKEVMI